MRITKTDSARFPLEGVRQKVRVPKCGLHSKEHVMEHFLFSLSCALVICVLVPKRVRVTCVRVRVRIHVRVACGCACGASCSV